MSAPELLALSLALSVAVSALAWLAGSVVERVSPDPGLRDGVWGAGLLLSAIPPLAVAALLLAPAPVTEIATPAFAKASVMVAPMVRVAAAPTPAALPDAATVAWLFLAAALALGLLRLRSLAVRIVRLARLLRQSVPADGDLMRRVEATAQTLALRPPRTVVSPTATEALLSGLGRPCLILSQASAEAAASDAVIAHELAHLKRGDHRTLWLEEALVILLAINPLMPVLRARRDAAREEACDALALSSAEPAVRRAYAQTLIQALKTRAGPQGPGDPVAALTFTGAGRTSAMHRLKAVIAPAAPAGRRTRLFAAALGLAVAVAAGGATVALAGQREAEVRMAAGPQPDRAADRAGSASQAAAQGALGASPPEMRARFQGASAADYRTYCASADAANEGFCAGVMFSHLARAPGNGLCVPEAGGDERARLTAIVARGKAEIARLTPRRDEGAYEYSERALKAAYPCTDGQGEASVAADGIEIVDEPASGTPRGVPEGGARLQLSLATGGTEPRAGDVLVVRLTGEDADGARYDNRSEFSVGPDGALPDAFFVDLAPSYFPEGGERRVYALTAEIRREGQPVYASQPSEVRLAPNSQRSVSRLRPVLELAPI